MELLKLELSLNRNHVLEGLFLLKLTLLSRIFDKVEFFSGPLGFVFTIQYLLFFRDWSCDSHHRSLQVPESFERSLRAGWR